MQVTRNVNYLLNIMAEVVASVNCTCAAYQDSMHVIDYLSIHVLLSTFSEMYL